MAIWQHYKRVLGIFSPRMRRNGYLWTSGQKSDPAIRHYRVTFTGYIRCFVLLRRMTLWPWPLTLWPWECVMYSASRVWPTYQFLLSYDYRLLSYEYWISDHISVFWNRQSLRMRCVTWPLTGDKNSSHFWNPWLQFAYSLCHFQGATTKFNSASEMAYIVSSGALSSPTTKFKPCHRQKIAFSHYEGYKVYCACAVSRDLCIGGPQKPHVTIFLTPNCLFTIQLLCGYHDDNG